MLATVDWNAVGALCGVFGVMVILSGGAAKRLRTRAKARRDRQDTAMDAEHAADAALRNRVGVLEEGQKEVMGVLKGRTPTWNEPHPPPGLVEKVDKMGGTVDEVLAIVQRIDRNGNGHS